MNLEQLISQEQKYQFTQINQQVINQLAKILVDKMNEQSLDLVIDISFIHQPIFYYASLNTSQDKKDWIKRKQNVVFRFKSSSYYIAMKNNYDNDLFLKKYALHEKDYACVGGAFPLLLKGFGLVGAISVSGLKPEEDHQFIITCLECFFNKDVEFVGQP